MHDTSKHNRFHLSLFSTQLQQTHILKTYCPILNGRRSIPCDIYDTKWIRMSRVFSFLFTFVLIYFFAILWSWNDKTSSSFFYTATNFFPSFIFLSLNSWGSAPATVNAYYNSVLNRISTWVGYYIKLFCNEFYFHVMQKLIYHKNIASWAVVAQLFHWPKSYEIYPKNLTIHSFIVFPAGILQPPFFSRTQTK